MPEHISTGHFVYYEVCASNFLVELHLGDVLEVLLVVGKGEHRARLRVGGNYFSFYVLKNGKI